MGFPGWVAVAAAAVLAVPVSAPAGRAAPRADVADCPVLNADPAWFGDNRAALQDFIDRTGVCTRPDGNPLAVFDWDNTMVRNDTGDATLVWMLRNNKVRQPDRKDWTTTSRYLTPAAADALSIACADTAETGQPLPTADHAPCADEILSVYLDAETTDHEPAFGNHDHRRTEPALAWAAQLLAGWTVDEVTAFARTARRESLAAPQGSTLTVGTRQVPAWVRYYEQMADLTGTLQRAGFDVRVVSASAEPVARIWAEALGIPGEKVIGVRNRLVEQELTPHLVGCGGAEEDTVIPYVDGKRCFINQEILGITGGAAFERAPAKRRQAFAAGDSTTDVTFVGDATGLRLAINRHHRELMCRAYDNADGKWLVNPMFIDPLPRRASPYPCSTIALTRPDGSAAPLLDDRGRVVPDQADTAY
ncbi:haloacid dehalogenase-like hydrolase [Kitasatospora purpeofusca]|uniref:phosphoserine phosphatase n=1 Tax=Kitasatospora purpeofusca TaxID=67352 RepID=A0ABZ1UB55_9ACTN|nr:haloacid dehalogenase-like hydrolase [Kitasatospora purpeofusca]